MLADADVDGRLHVALHPQPHRVGLSLLDRHVGAVELHAAGDELRAGHALRRLAAVDVASFLGEHDVVVAVAVLHPAGSQPVGKRPFHAAAEQFAFGRDGLLEQDGRQGGGGEEWGMEGHDSFQFSVFSFGFWVFRDFARPKSIFEIRLVSFTSSRWGFTHRHGSSDEAL